MNGEEPWRKRPKETVRLLRRPLGAFEIPLPGRAFAPRGRPRLECVDSRASCEPESDFRQLSEQTDALIRSPVHACRLTRIFSRKPFKNLRPFRSEERCGTHSRPLWALVPSKFWRSACWPPAVASSRRPATPFKSHFRNLVSSTRSLASLHGPQYLVSSPSPSPSTYVTAPVPQSLSDFSCYAVNVTGSAPMTQLRARRTPVRTWGLRSATFPASTQSVSVTVPDGNIQIQLIGIESLSDCPT